MIATWRPVPGWESLYEVSDTGGVRSLPRIRDSRFGTRRIPMRELHPRVHRDGYAYVDLRDRGERSVRPVHQLVLEAFVEPCPTGQECRHLNGTRTDNRLENLAWGTRLQNAQDRVLHGTQARGTRHAHARLTPDLVVQIRELNRAGWGTQRIANHFGRGRSTIEAVLTGRTWAHVPVEAA